MVSISSMKMIAGATFLASAKSSRTRPAPTPTIISMNSEALALKKGTFASPAVARASSCLARSRRPGQQHALRSASTEPTILLRVLQEINDLIDFSLNFVDTGDIVECHADLLGIDALLLAPSQQSASHRLLLALEHPYVETYEQENRGKRNKKVGQETTLLDERCRPHRGSSVRQLRQQVIGSRMSDAPL
jgi:hypothetical protein